MNILSIISIGLFSYFAAAQDLAPDPNDSLRTQAMDEVVVTATRIPQQLKEIPQRVDVVSLLRLRATPMLSAVDGMSAVAGANVRQPRGIFSRNTLVSLRGMGTEQGRTLVMIDGAPLNKSSTGAINLNRLNPDCIERIEVAKGPGSSLYGGSAMGGVVNYLTRLPEEPLQGSCEVRWGEMGTFATQLSLGGRTPYIYYRADGFFQESDGYILTPKDARKAGDIPTFLHEYALSGLVGTEFGRILSDRESLLSDEESHSPRRQRAQRLEAEVRFYEGTRGQGSRFFLDEAATQATDSTRRHLDLAMRFRERDVRLLYRARLGGDGQSGSGATLQASAFYSREDYVETKSKNSALYDVDCLREDWNLKVLAYGRIGGGTSTRGGGKGHLLSGGLELKGGSVDGRDIYRTSSDRVVDRGHSLLFGLWMQDEWALAEGRIRLVPSLRLDHARVYDGGFFIYDGTAATDLYAPYTGSLDDHHWTALSPKLSAQYAFGGSHRLYVTTGWGFRPGNLEDMVRVGPGSGGMTLGNTALKPEHVWSVEAGADVTLFPGSRPLSLSPSVYHSRGTDFIYPVNTGDSIVMNGRTRPIYAMKNLARVSIVGAECEVSWTVSPTLTVQGNAGWTRSEVRSGTASISGVETDLRGKLLTYVPRYKAAVGLTWRNRAVPLTATWVQYGRQYTDDLNTALIPSYGTLDLKVWRTLGGGRATVSLNARNLLDRQQDIGGELTVGRMVFGELRMRF